MSLIDLAVSPDLIFDFGMHHGLDTEFYLKKGFRVVAVEANPILASAARERFAKFVASGQLAIENVGVAQVEGTLPFFRNLENDEWSSFNKERGTRNGTKFETIELPCVRTTSLLLKHGMPHYMKIDIEGFDPIPVAALWEFSTRPNFLSVEDNSIHSLLQLYGAGARAFKFVDQIEKWEIRSPNPPLEGEYVDATFGRGTSGLFGRELPGEWLPIDHACHFYLEKIRPPGGALRNKHWWDIHVRFSA